MGTFLTPTNQIHTYRNKVQALNMTSDSVAQPLVSRTVWLGRSFWRMFHKSSPVITQRKATIMKDINEKFNFDFTTPELYERKSINMKTSDLSKSFKLDFDMPI